MPIYEFTCEECDENFEKLVRLNYLLIGRVGCPNERSSSDLPGN